MNHKKKNETKRNSLIVHSIELVKEIKPRYFIFENVKTFLKTICTNIDNREITISDAIDTNLGGLYNILKEVVNFKDYGSNSSRTRTLIIGVRKDLKGITPYDIFPSQENGKTLKEIISKYKALSVMGEIDPNDIYHHFRRYDNRMLDWIKDVKEGQSAFDNSDPHKIPHRVIDNQIVYNQKKNGDKYTRCEWNKVAPCIHTRNDILSSQATIHPVDNRVFSIRELMDIMTIPTSFKWVEQDLERLNEFSLKEKEAFLKNEAMNIRQSIGEAVPTVIFRKIANNIIVAENKTISNKTVKEIVKERKLSNSFDKTLEFIKENPLSLLPNLLSKVAEFANAEREILAAFYTPKSICFSLVKELPTFENKTSIKILEPSVGLGNFINLLSEKYKNKQIELDVIDKDKNSLELLKILYSKQNIPNIKINYINEDFLLFDPKLQYDVIIGNPPFGKIKDKNLVSEYNCKNNFYNKDTKNIFAMFLEKSLSFGRYVSFITPKSLLAAPEFNKTRELIEKGYTIKSIIDFGENGFDGVKIETIGLSLKNVKNLAYNVKIESYITQTVHTISNTDLFDSDFNYWLIYKDDFFKKMKKSMKFGIYTCFRDRTITKQITKPSGKIRVLKSRNIGDNEIINIKDYDSFIDDTDNLAVSKYINSQVILVPNLTYNPRACFMPKNCIADGSVAILQPIHSDIEIVIEDLAYYSTYDFSKFYAIGRNFGTRSLNIDSNSVNLFGIRKRG